MTTNPRILIDPKDVLPSFYKLFYRRSICKNCGITHSYTEVAAALPPLQGSGIRYVMLHRPLDVEYNLPVRVETVEATTVPFCHTCWRPGMLNHLPTPQPKPAPPSPTWVGTGPARPKPPPPQAKKPKTYTIDDLDID